MSPSALRFDACAALVLRVAMPAAAEGEENVNHSSIANCSHLIQFKTSQQASVKSEITNL